MIHYSHCPVCRSASIQSAFIARDFTVSQEDFPVWKCSHCMAMFTQDIPPQNQVGKYYQSENYISHSDTQKGFINQLYHRIRKTTLIKKMKMIKAETRLQHGNILDIGCGTGAFLNTMKQAGWNITGLEPDEGARRTAQALYNIQPLPSEKIFEQTPNTFHAITAWHVLEHVHQLHEYIEQFKKLLVEGGRLFIAVPNYTSSDATAYKTYWAAYDVPRHLYHFSPQSMNILVGMHGMKVEKIKPMWFDSFYVSMLSEQYRNGRGNIVRAFVNGFVSNCKAVFNKSKCSSVIYVVKSC